MAKTTKKIPTKLFILMVQDDDGKIIKIFTGDNYENVWLQGSTESKSARGYWTMFRFPDGKFIDGNYKVPNIR